MKFRSGLSGNTIFSWNTKEGLVVVRFGSRRSLRMYTRESMRLTPVVLVPNSFTKLDSMCFCSSEKTNVNAQGSENRYCSTSECAELAEKVNISYVKNSV